METMFPALPHVLLGSIVAFSLLLMLLRPKNIAEVWWVSAGALLLLAFRLVPLRLAGKAVAQGSDVYFFLFGMMLLAELARVHGVFDWVSSAAVGHANGDCGRLFTWIYGVGTLTTLCLSNDATAVVLTPAILAAVRKAKVAPLPHLFACAMIANAASFLLPISNPANLVVFHSGMPSLGRWLGSFSLPSVFSIAVTFLVLRWYFRQELAGPIEQPSAASPLNANGKLVLGGLAVMVAVLLTASACRLDLGLPACVAALLIAAAVCLRARSNPLQLLSAISWSTLLLVAGLFILVNAVESLGALHHTQTALRWVEHLPVAPGALLVSFVLGWQITWSTICRWA